MHEVAYQLQSRRGRCPALFVGLAIALASGCAAHDTTDVDSRHSVGGRGVNRTAFPPDPRCLRLGHDRVAYALRSHGDDYGPFRPEELPMLARAQSSGTNWGQGVKCIMVFFSGTDREVALEIDPVTEENARRVFEASGMDLDDLDWVLVRQR